MKRTTPIDQQGQIGDLIRQSMLERVFEIRVQACFIKKFRGMQVGEIPPKRIIRLLRHSLEYGQGHDLTDDGSHLQDIPSLRGQSIDARGQHGLNGRGHLDGLHRSLLAIGTALTNEDLRLDEGPDALFEKERIPFCLLDEQALEWLKADVAAEKDFEQFLGTRRGEGVEPKLRVVRLVPPLLYVLWAVVDEEEHSRRRETLDQSVQEHLALTVDPVQVLDEQHERLHVALPDQETLDAVQDAFSTLRRLEARPL